MNADRRNTRKLESTTDSRRMVTTDSFRTSTADSGRGSMTDSSRPSTLDISPINGASSSLSRDTPLSGSEVNVDNSPGKLEVEKPVRIPRNVVLGNKCYQQAYVSHVDHPSAFFLQLPGSDKQFRELHEQINEYYSENPMNNSSSSPLWKRGDYCIAKSKDDGFLRARIIATPQVNGASDMYGVVFVDFGNWDKVVLTDIHRLLPKFATLQAQAIACSLTHTLPPNNTSSYESGAIKLFQELVLDEFVNATFYLKTKRDFWQLSFVDLEVCSSGINVRDYLKEKKFIQEVENEKIYPEFNDLMSPEDYIIYSIPHEDDEDEDD